jgi:YidC/Oxa1 family membrane protein insertase
MDKTGKFAVALAIAIMVGCFIYDVKHPAPPPPPAAASASPSPTAPGAATTPGSEATPATSVAADQAAPQAAPAPELPEQKQEINSPVVNFTFTNHGGGIDQAVLTTHLQDPDNSRKDVVLNSYGPIPIGAISDQAGEGATVSYTASQDAQGGISYQRTTAQQLQITKKYTLPTAKDGKDQYLVTLDLSITNQGAKPYKSAGYYVYLGSAAPIHPKDQSRYICMDWYLNGKAAEINAVSAFNESKIPLIGYQLHPEKTEYTAAADNIGWAGVHSQYFTTIVAPTGDRKATSIWARRFPLDVDTHVSGDAWLRNNPNTTPTLYGIYGALGMPGYELAPGKVYTQQFQIYVGPREYRILKQMDQGQSAILQLGYSASINKFLLSMMNLLHTIPGISYAVAIIILTVVLKLCLWPLQNTATQSMKKMQALSPKMTEMREKYKDDPAKLNQETIKLYKTYGVNPLAGCLPMVIQLPIFVGFYSMLGSAIELRNSRFFWVHDLSQPDTVGHILGFPINVLPLCMAVTNLWMTRLTPKSGDSTQQKMMLFMPLTLLLFCYNYASGLALYLMVSNLFSVAQLYLTRNQAAPTLEKIAAAAASKKKR